MINNIKINKNTVGKILNWDEKTVAELIQTRKIGNSEFTIKTTGDRLSPVGH